MTPMAYPATPRFHDYAPVFSRVSTICEYGVLFVRKAIPLIVDNVLGQNF